MDRYRYLLCIADGCADEPVTVLRGRTPLEAAHTPVLDRLAEGGEVGRATTIPDGMPPGSDVGIMAILGYDPRLHHRGRASIEAAGMGVRVGPQQVAYRCNLVTVADGAMVDSGGGAPGAVLPRLVATALNRRFGRAGLRFYPGEDFRLLMVAPEEAGNARCVPPHDLIGRPVVRPIGPSADLLNELMDYSHALLTTQDVDVTQLWPWGAGRATVLPSFRDAYNLDARVVTGVDIVRGLGTLAGMNVPSVPGANGRCDTDYDAKRGAVVEAFDDGADLVVLHVEATDTAGHLGDLAAKVTALESWDSRLLAPVCEELERRGPWRILFLPDHPTPVARRTHTADPVPYLIYDSKRSGPGGHYSERGVVCSPDTSAVVLLRRLIDGPG